ncbi:hypothetical protein PENARI_c013G06428 [Penicillium arizonense]|uniref:Uncharacterized protein n=1 Tax=Penicillium arizonense TaxID=1835702 RepID=A0A1F5LEC9_PENAI|nr:hypothetical protein PENARI_c013G06428 [Penicillium arizonense]OGE51568.1 hypothetical protein PENARI_c013G06428 [Penicillium arizonense]
MAAWTDSKLLMALNPDDSRAGLPSLSPFRPHDMQLTATEVVLPDEESDLGC